jgi:hypothetical protein
MIDHAPPLVCGAIGKRKLCSPSSLCVSPFTLDKPLPHPFLSFLSSGALRQPPEP